MSDANKRHKVSWRSPDELAQRPEFEEVLPQEFPQRGSEGNNDWSRRNFLTLMGASLALAGLTACRRPEQKIVPYVKPPEETVPGIPQYYATTMPIGTSAYGVIVETHEGRPTKIEGNPKHPSTLGASNAWMQASILGLYDPDRSKRVMHNGQESSWDDFVAFWREHAAEYAGNRGEGLAVLSESFASPTLARLRREFLKKYRKARWIAYDPVSNEEVYEGILYPGQGPGRVCQPVYDLSRAEVVLSFDCDFLGTESHSLTSAKGFAERRRLESEHDSMNRLYMVEAGFSITGAAADHRLALRGTGIARLVRALHHAMDYGGSLTPGDLEKLELKESDGEWVNRVAEELLSAKGKSLVLAGRGQPREIHAMVLSLNDYLGNVGKTVKYHSAPDMLVSSIGELTQLVEDAAAGRITTLLMLGGNPCYNAPADLEFRQALEKVETSIHLSDYFDETSRQTAWHIPRAHYLESWGDASAADGRPSVIQPLIAPLFNGIASVEMANLMASGSKAAGYEIVQATWRDILGRNDFEEDWRKTLHDGISPTGQSDTIRLSTVHIGKAEVNSSSYAFGPAGGSELMWYPSPSLFDGRFANNGWLQELPHPVTKLTWDNAALVSPKTAKEHDLGNGDVVKLTCKNRELELPVWIVPGMADDAVLLELGYGQKNLGRVADAVGFNTYALTISEIPFRLNGTPDDPGPPYYVEVALTKTGKTYPLASTQDHGSMEGRPHVREATLEGYRKHPDFAPEAVHHPPLVSMWEDHKYDEGYQWGMAIDLTACTGCNACTVACQSENNIPIVGKEQVANGREMHWLRVDRYFTGDINQPSVVYQPVACQHCEMAPCEQVCPVAATMHDKEGLNTMVYNRCIGTRYCSNNCPYKVRRFNFFNFTKDTPEVTKMVNNPDVTVRSRGVMEKCTFCVQRINGAKIEAKKENRSVRDGEITTACQQACPTRAIVFGDINNPESEVSKVKQRNRNYALLGELNVRPRISYLAKIRNPNPKMPESG